MRAPRWWRPARRIRREGERFAQQLRAERAILNASIDRHMAQRHGGGGACTCPHMVEQVDAFARRWTR